MKVIVVGSNHAWGRADNLPTAFKNAYRPKHYVAFVVSDGTTVDEVTGGLFAPTNDIAPFEIVRKMPRKKAGAR